MVEFSERRGDEDEFEHTEAIDIVEQLADGKRDPDDPEVARALRIVTGLARVALNSETLIQRYKDMSVTDQLTGVLNRRGLVTSLQEYLQLVEFGNRSTDPVGLVVIMTDNDLFKRVNDTYGHLVGDKMLEDTAKILTAAVRDGDTVGRLGGDEFIIMLPIANPGADEEGIIEDKALVDAADGITAEVTSRLQSITDEYNGTLDDEGKHIRFSWGATVVFFGDGSSPVADVLRRADLALYTAKRSNKEARETEASETTEPEYSWLTGVRRRLGGYITSMLKAPSK